MKLCACCGVREAGGLGWDEVVRGYSPKTKLRFVRVVKEFNACSFTCMNIIHDRQGKMIDPTENEISAMEDAGQAGGEFLTALGKTDLEMLTEDEWMQFVDAICTGFVESMQARQAPPPPPSELRRAALFGGVHKPPTQEPEFLENGIPF